MCGIAGILSFNGPINISGLYAANARMAHRGPDDMGIYADPAGRMGFAQRRLSIIDLSALGHQPMVRQEKGGDVVINFNGEIYNFRELREECNAVAVRLRGEVIPWQGGSDTEVLLWAYLLFGRDMLAMLDGMFALAIWDGRTGEIVVARDRFGVKPLYYSYDSNRFVFASEIKALSALTELDRAIDPLAVVQYVTFLYTPGDRTMFESVKKLGPGEAMVLSLKGLNRRFVFCRSDMLNPSDSTMPEQEAIEGVRGLLAKAVERQMIADVPLGAFLSGGLDSSSVVAMARMQGNHGRLQCFTIGQHGTDTLKEGWVSDLPYAQRVAKHLDVDLHTIWVGPEMADQFAWMIGQLDEPQADPAALNAFFICKLARENGIKVLLSGAGGDDLFSGYRRHYAISMERWWSWLPVNMRAAVGNYSQGLSVDNPFGRRLSKALRYASLDEAQRLVTYFMWLDAREANMLWSPDLAAKVAGSDPASSMYAAVGTMHRRTGRLARMLLLDSKFFLVDHNLNYTDKMSMAASVEVRVPFLDNHLAEFAARIPAHFKQRGPEGKWVLKKAMEGILPDDVIHRPKTGFGVPLRRWMNNQMRGLLDDTLSEKTLRRRGLFDPAGVKRLRQRNESGQVDAAYPLLAVSCIELWCRAFVDRN